jgi:hypothetical protein
VPIKLIAVDIDGTLLPTVAAPTDLLEISARNRRALREAQASGIKIVVATGRRQAYAAPLIDPIGLSPETGMITSNGAVTRTLSGRRIDRFFLPAVTARDLCAPLRRFGGTTVFTFDRPGSDELVVESLPQLNDRIAAWVQANRASISEITPLERAFDNNDEPVQGMVCGTISHMREAEQWLHSNGFTGKIETHRTEYPLRDLSILDILPPGVSKGVALRSYAAAHAIQPSEIMAIGDNFNDLEMLELAGNPVAMAGSAPGLLVIAQDRGWQITASNDDDGVAQAIESVLEAIPVQ